MHLIHQHRFDIQVAERQHAHEWHKALGDVMNDVFYPRLEKLFDRYDRAGVLHQFDTLEISVSNISMRNWREKLVDQMLTQIEEVLILKCPATPSSPHSAQNEDSAAGIQFYAENLILDFLSTGVLSPNVMADSVRGIAINAMPFTEAFFKKVKLVLQEDAIRIVRFTQHLPEEVIKGFLALYSIPMVDARLIMQVAAILTGHQMKKESLYRGLTIWFAKHQGHVYTAEQVTSLVRWLKTFFYTEQFMYLKEETDSIISKHMQLQGSSPIADTLQKALARLTGNKVDDLQAESSSSRSLSKAKLSAEEIKHDDETVDINIKQRAGSSIHIHNAGLVILHPFLQDLFQKLHYVDEQKKLKANCVHKAVCYTQWLLSAQEEFFENELVLNKILCGVPPEAVIDIQQSFTEEEKETGIQLLTAVIKHWSILKNTSVTGLQQTFLLRKGILRNNVEEWELQVESSAVDILLDQLPWGISFIILPWMDRGLIVNWQ